MKEKSGEHPLGDVGQIVLFGLFMIVWILDSFFLRWSTFLSDHIPLVFRLAMLGITLTIATYLFRSGHVVVNHEQRSTGVVSSGAFRYVRHPLYLGSILIYFGLTASTTSLLCLILMIVIFLFYNAIAGYEEKLLEIKWGDAYLAYKKKSGKWLPMFGKRLWQRSDSEKKTSPGRTNSR